MPHITTQLPQTALEPVTSDDALVSALQQANSQEATWDLYETCDAGQLDSRWDEIAAGWDQD